VRVIRFCSVVEASCHKQDALMRDAAAFVDRGRRTTHKRCNTCLYFTVEMSTTCDGPTEQHTTVHQWSMPKPYISRESRSLSQLVGSRRNIAITFGVEKLQNGVATWRRQFFEDIYLLRQNTQNCQTDGQTDGQTDRRTPHAYHCAAKIFR